MTNAHPPNPLRSLLDRIERGEVHMRSRARFIAVAALTACGFFVALVGAVFLVSFALFLMRMSGASVLPRFGFHGMRLLVTAMPWALIVAGVALVVALVILARRLPTAYRRPVAYSVVAACILTGVLAVAVARTPFHATLRAQERTLPILGPFYQYHRIDRVRGVRVGTVAQRAASTLMLDTTDGAVRVRMNDATRFPIDRTFDVGDRIIVIGEQTEDGFLAYGIRPADGRWRERYRPRGSGEWRPRRDRR